MGNDMVGEAAMSLDLNLRQSNSVYLDILAALKDGDSYLTTMPGRSLDWQWSTCVYSNSQAWTFCRGTCPLLALGKPFRGDEYFCQHSVAQRF